MPKRKTEVTPAGPTPLAAALRKFRSLLPWRERGLGDPPAAWLSWHLFAASPWSTLEAQRKEALKKVAATGFEPPREWVTAPINPQTDEEKALLKKVCLQVDKAIDFEELVALAAAGGKPAGTVNPPTGDDELIRAAVASDRFNVSSSTLRQAVRDGRLKDYRVKSKRKSTSPLIVSRDEVAARWTPRKKQR